MKKSNFNVLPYKLKCPKCGGNNATRHYRRAGEIWTTAELSHDEPSEFINHITDWTREASRECITHHCLTCHYDWQTKPLKK